MYDFTKSQCFIHVHRFDIYDWNISKWVQLYFFFFFFQNCHSGRHTKQDFTKWIIRKELLSFKRFYSINPIYYSLFSIVTVQCTMSCVRDLPILPLFIFAKPKHFLLKGGITIIWTWLLIFKQYFTFENWNINCISLFSTFFYTIWK